MDKEKHFAEELAKGLKKKKIRKFALIAIVAVIAVSAIIGLNIEDRDSLLEDGQGNIVTNNQSDDNTQKDDKEDSDNKTNNDGQGNGVANNQSDDNTQKGDKEDGNNTTNNNGQSGGESSGKPGGNTSSNKKPTPEDSKVDNSNDSTASNDGNEALKPDKAKNVTVTISIRCDIISNNMDKLTDPSIADYIPSDGVILKRTTYKGTTDNTVFDVLNTVCRNNNIHLDFKYTPLYESHYIKGINYLYEFHGGNMSGWMYKVNGWFPNYGVSNYYLKDGEEIEFVYTCDGGQDVGDNYMG